MKRFLVVVVVACAFLAFFVLVNHTPRKTPDSASPARPSSAATAPAAHVFDIGDVEAGLHLDGVLDTRSYGANVKEEKLLNIRDDLDMSTITVTPPAPKELWVQFTSVAKRHPLDSPVAIRGKVLREKEVIGAFSKVIVPQKPNDATCSVDVFSGLEKPVSMLVHAEAELILLKSDEDPATVDPNALPATPAETGHLLSNPVRIEYNTGAGK